MTKQEYKALRNAKKAMKAVENHIDTYYLESCRAITASIAEVDAVLKTAKG